MRIDSYTLKARYFPVVLTIVLPIAAFNHFYTSVIFANLVDNIIGMKVVSNITISTISLFLFVQLGRILGKTLENVYFKEESTFYTTKYLTYKNQFYPDLFKEKLAQSIMTDFSIKLMNKKEEQSNYIEALKLIVLAVGQIRKKMYNNKFLLQHNIEYGFARNLVGGSLIGFLISLLCIYFFSKIHVVELSRGIFIGLSIIYFLLILVSKPILTLLSKSYAKILYREYFN